VTQEDFEAAIGRVQSSVGNSELEKYQQWMTEFGSV
jgi:SpoVK/Ycf46/Vps4 family AAA+-type ATPase